MSYEDKVIPCQSPSPKSPIPKSPSPSQSICLNTNTGSPQTPVHQIEALHGTVAILWDIENCPVPCDVCPEDVAGNIRLALRVHPFINGAVTMFSAYGDFNAFSRRLREGCQRTGVKLVDVPNGRKDAADKAILVDMFLFALDNPSPSSILLISGDVDFAPALHILGQRGYTVILVIPSGVGVSSALTNAGRFVWDWPSVARGEGFLPPGTGFTFGDTSEVPNEEEAIVCGGISQNSYNTVQEYISNNSSMSQSFPSGLSDQNGLKDCWVKPGDIQGLKGQLVRLLETWGGSLPFVRIPPEYLKSFGRPLYLSEYGVCKLANLVKKMEDTLIVEGTGTSKQLCLRSDMHVNKCARVDTETKDKKGKEILVRRMDIDICRDVSSSSDDSSDDDMNGDFEERLDSLKQEVQELLVCYSCPVPLTIFESLYEQRYKKALEFQSFGVDGLEELMEKVREVVLLFEDPGSKRKFLMSR